MREQNTGYARRDLFWKASGRGFDSPRLHHFALVEQQIQEFQLSIIKRQHYRKAFPALFNKALPEFLRCPLLLYRTGVKSGNKHAHQFRRIELYDILTKRRDGVKVIATF